MLRMRSSSVKEQLSALVSRPPVHRGLQTLDRSLFERHLDMLAVSVPSFRIAEGLKVVKDHFLRQPGFSSFADDEHDSSRKLLILTENTPDTLSSSLRARLEAEDWPLRPYRLHINYEHWTATDILHAVLPEELTDEAPSSFSRVGHIAHLNLREDYLPYKKVIGQVILEKNPGIRTVVNKVDTIDNEYRFFKMEVLAGEPDFIAEVNEGGCRFRFDFSSVYWNTRLSTEHARLVDLFAPTDVVVDAFAGVGPFALPAAKKGCTVLANDLNPASAQSLAANITLNKLDGRVRWYQEDARTFIRNSAVELWERPLPPAGSQPSRRQRKAQARAAHGPPMPDGEPSRFPDHYIMNLPASAIEYLGAFRNLYAPLSERKGWKEALGTRPGPLVHCYCFAVASTDWQAEQDICERASAYLGCSLSHDVQDYSLAYVRSVAPGKNMFRLTFRLPIDVLLADA